MRSVVGWLVISASRQDSNVIPKIILSGSYSFGDPSMSLVRLHSRGVDSNYLNKHAAAHGMFAKELAELKPIPGHTVLHCLAVGDEEWYGDNRNNDAFNEADNKVCHDRFKKHGHVFKNHKNWSPELATGFIHATGHNDDMHRIELLAALDNAKYAEEIEAIEQGEGVPFSMGSMQAYDVCSVCGHKAPTGPEHCSHIQNKLGEVLGDGRKVFMRNPNPDYFDFSTVWKNADRIALSLRKVASANGAVGGHDLAEAMGVRGWNSQKQATLIRLAEIEKRIPAVGRPIASTAPKKLSVEAVQQLKRACQLNGTDEVLGALHRAGRMLGFHDFLDVIVGTTKVAQTTDLQGGFARLLDSNDDIQSLDGTLCHQRMWLGDEAEYELQQKTSMDRQAVQSRVLDVSILRPKQLLITKTAADEIESRAMADLYLHYKLAFADANRDKTAIVAAVALSNSCDQDPRI